MRLDFSNIGQGLSAIAEAVTERKRREQLEALGPSAQAVSGLGYEVIDPQGRVSQGLATPDFDLNAARQAYEQAGYQLRPIEGPGLGQQYAARAGSRDLGMFGSEADAERAAARYDVGLARQRADVYAQTGQRELAERMRQVAAAEGRALTAEDRARQQFETQQKKAGFEIEGLQRQSDFNTSLASVFDKEYKDPTERTAAILDVYRRYDPKAAADLEAKYGANELNQIALNSAKFDQGFKQARAKGVDSVISWYDSVNDGFTLRRDGNKIIQTDTNGNSRIFAQGTDDQIMMRMDALAKPGGFLELALGEAEILRRNAMSSNYAGLGDSKEMQQLTAAGRFISGRLGDIDKIVSDQMAFKRLPLDQQKALVAERNRLVGQLSQIETRLTQGLVGGQPAGAGANPMDEAMRIARSGVNPVTNKPFTNEEKQEFTRRTGLPFPEPEGKKETKGLRSGGASSPRSQSARGAPQTGAIPEPPPEFIVVGRGLRKPNPEYDRWNRRYGASYRAQTQAE